MKVYRNGIEIHDLIIDSRTQLSQRLMGRDLITMDVTVDSKLDIRIGDYVTYGGINYTINRPVLETEVSEVEYRYSLQFEGPYYELLDKKLMLAGKAEFHLTGYLTDFVDLIVSNINEIHAGWSKGAVVASDWKNLYFSGKNCKEALEQLANEFSVEFSIVGKTINLVERVETATGLTFKHGKGKGLYELTRENVDDGNTVTRVFAFGSTRNLPFDYRGGAGRLVFQNLDGTRYLENTSQYSRIIEQIVTFDNIWPRFEGAVSAVSADKLTITCPDIDFDLNAQLLPGITAKVVFLDGDTMGNQFEISAFNNATKQVTLVAATSEGGLVMPSAATFYPAPGDRFVFVDIKMPQSYVDAAEAKLKAAAQAYLDYYSKLRIKFSLKLDHRYIRDNNITLKVGDVVRILSTGTGIDEQIRITSLRSNLDGSGVTAEISNFIEERFTKQVTNQLNDTLAALTSVQSSIDRQTIITSVTKGARVWGGTEAKRIDELSPVIPDSSYSIEVDKSGLTQSGKASLDNFWLKNELVQSSGYLLYSGTKIKSGYADNSGLLNNFADSDFWKKTELVQSGGYLLYGGEKIKAGDSDKLGGIVAANYYHTGNANKTDVSWSMNNGTIAGYATSPAYTSGFAGSGWRIDPADNRLTVDNLTVRKEMSVYELVINQIRGTNGSLWVSDAAKVKTVTGGGTYYRCYIDTDGGNMAPPFAVDDWIRCQKWTGRGVKYYSAKVTSVGADYFNLTKTGIDGAGVPEAGDTVVRIGNATNANRQGAVYITSSDNNSPYLDVLDGVISSSLSGKTKVRLGKLDGVTDPDLGVLSGYGLYGENVYLKGKIIVTGGNAETLTGAQTKADNAQTTAINTAASDATSKANTAQSNAESHASGLVNSLSGSLGDMAYQDVVNLAKLDSTIIEGGYIKSTLLDVSAIKVSGSLASLAEAQSYASTAQSNAVSAAATDATAKVNAVEVGGRNLLRNTIYSSGVTGYKLTDGKVLISGNLNRMNLTTYPITEAGYYSLSYWVRVENFSGNFSINPNINDRPLATKSITGNIDWTYVSGTVWVSSYIGLYGFIDFEGVGSGSTVTISDVTVVKGTKPLSQYVPAPEDVSADATTKGNAAQSAAQAYADGLAATLNAAKQDAIVNGQTLIVGGYLNTGFIEAGAIVAEKIATGAIVADKIAAGTITGDKIAAGTIDATRINAANLHVSAANVDGTLQASQINFDGASGNNVNLNGTITATSGAVGNFNISSGSIINEGGNGYVSCRNSTSDRFASIGSEVLPSALGGMSAVSYFKNSKSNPYATNYGVYGYARNGGTQYPGVRGSYAGYFDGHSKVINGVLEASTVIPSDKVYSISNADNTMPPAGYLIYHNSNFTANRNVYLPYPSSYEVGECITFTNWNGQDMYLYARSGNSINGYLYNQAHVQLRDIGDTITLRAVNDTQWMVVSAGGTGFRFYA